MYRHFCNPGYIYERRSLMIIYVDLSLSFHSHRSQSTENHVLTMTGRSLLLLLCAFAVTTVSTFAPTKAFVRTSTLKVRVFRAVFSSEVQVVALVLLLHIM